MLPRLVRIRVAGLQGPPGPSGADLQIAADADMLKGAPFEQTKALSPNIWGKWRSEISLRQNGAKFDGTTNDQQAIVGAMADAVFSGRPLVWDGNGGATKFTQSIAMPAGLSIRGEFGAAVLKPSGMALTTTVISNVHNTIVSKDTYTDLRPALHGLIFDGSNFAYIPYLSDPNLSPTDPNYLVTDPANDSRRNLDVQLAGRMVNFTGAIDPIVENCQFRDFHSFPLSFIGCQFPKAWGNSFLRCGKKDWVSPSLLVLDWSVARWITRVTTGVTTVLTISQLTSYTVGQQVYIQGVNKSGIAAFADGLQTIIAITGLSDIGVTAFPCEVTISLDSSGYNGTYMMLGEAIMSSATYTPSIGSELIGNTFQDLDRIPMQISSRGGGLAEGNHAHGWGEGGLFMLEAKGWRIKNNSYENGHITDITCAGIDLDFCVDLQLSGNYTKDTDTSGLQIIGGIGISCIGNDFHQAYKTLNLTYPYGPFSERAFFNIGFESLAGTLLPEVRKVPVMMTNYSYFPVASVEILGGSISDTRNPTPSNYAITFSHAGTFQNIYDVKIDMVDLDRFNSADPSKLIAPLDLRSINPDRCSLQTPDEKIYETRDRTKRFRVALDRWSGNFHIVQKKGGGQLVLPPIYSPPTALKAITDSGITTGLAFCGDPGDTNSYNGSGQQWTDVSAVVNHFYRGFSSGVDIGDPQWHGTPDGKSDAEYWSSDGGDYFRPVTTPTFGANWHKTGAKFTTVMLVYVPAFGTGFRLWSTLGAGSGTGIYPLVTTTGALSVGVLNAGVSVTSQAIVPAFSLTAGAWQFIAISLDEAGGASGSLILMNDLLYTFNGHYISPSSGAADGTFTIGAGPGAQSPLASGVRVGPVAVWDGQALTETQLRTLRSFLLGRFQSI